SDKCSCLCLKPIMCFYHHVHGRGFTLIPVKLSSFRNLIRITYPVWNFSSCFTKPAACCTLRPGSHGVRCSTALAPGTKDYRSTTMVNTLRGLCWRRNGLFFVRRRVPTTGLA